MKDSVDKKDSYVRNNYGKEDLFEGNGDSNTLSDFLDLVVSNEAFLKELDFENVGQKIHQRVIGI